ncbi:MAG: restriction endonuclease subunit S [Anaerolineales bacterium]|nr:restriction endonuclease subunit S [Anaerolineales bacterium]
MELPGRSLKPGWQVYRFDQIAIIVNDRVEPGDTDAEYYVGLEHLDPDSLKIRRWGQPSDVEATKLRFCKGDIIFGRRRAYQRKLGVAEFDGICSAHAMVLRPKTEVVLPEFLPFFMQSDLFMNRALEISVGSLSPTINWRTLAEQEFALPPLAEQRRMAEVLWAAVVAKDNYRELVHITRKLWTATAEEYFSETGLAFDSGAKKSIRLGGLLDYSSDGPFGSKLKTEHYTEYGVRVIRLQNIDDRSFNNDDQAFISEAYYQETLTGYTVRPGDVIVAGLGDENIQPGRACIVPNFLGLAVNKADCYCLRPVKDLDARFLVCFFNSPYGLRQSMSFTQGTTRYRLNLGNIRRMLVPLPDLTVQQGIANTLDDIQSAENLAICKLEAQEGLLKKLLNSLFGENK